MKNTLGRFLYYLNTLLCVVADWSGGARVHCAVGRNLQWHKLHGLWFTCPLQICSVGSRWGTLALREEAITHNGHGFAVFDF